ncbi:hypothetical protein ASG53_12030 [Sanguibacter sp. Leaf3]|nr:hypothetical protein ASG53_12030 [Sanguibacter sp. Leaf3]
MLLVGAAGTATAYDVDTPPVVIAEDTSVTLAPGAETVVDIESLTSGTDYPAVYDTNIVVESGGCTAEWTYSAGINSVAITAPGEPGECRVAWSPHDALTSVVSAEPGQIAVTVAAPPPAAPATSSPAPAPVPAGPIDDGADVTEPVDPAPAPDTTSRSGGWQEAVVMGIAGLATVIGSGFALARHSRRSTYTHEEI